jgi:mannose-6-phosphate isomerase-like protein (cupin superfamily)
MLWWASIDEHENVTRFQTLAEKKQLALRDYGPEPFVINIEKATIQNKNYRTALWTGKHLQLTVMSINVGDDIGLEVHPTTDQFLRIEQGKGLVQMGPRQDQLNFTKKAQTNDAIFVPAGTWHNVTNTGSTPLKVYSIYAPVKHPFGTVHKTKPVSE